MAPLGEHVKAGRISAVQGVEPCHGRYSAEACQAGFLRTTAPANVSQKNAGLSCEARAASSTSAPQKKNSRTYHKNAGLSCEARAASSTSAQKNGRTPKDALRGTCQDRANFRDAKGVDPCHGRCSAEACQGPLCRSKRIPAEVLSAAKKVYLQRSSLPPRAYTCRGPAFPPGMMPAKVLFAAQRVYLQRSSPPTRNDAYRGPLCRSGGIPAEVLSARPR